jgi:hypothetical protein
METAFGATQCIGCSVFVAVNSRQLLMGHLAEEACEFFATRTIGWVPATQKLIIDHMEQKSDLFEESDNGHAWFVHSFDQRTPADAVLWKEYMEESICMPEN